MFLEEIDEINYYSKPILTRMHSSRMRTARFSDHLGVCPGGVHPPDPLHAEIHTE